MTYKIQTDSPAITAPRLAGIDLIRALAAFGVIVIHVGLVFECRVTPSVTAFQDAFNLFSVPLFLAAAFYFALPRPGALLSLPSSRSIGSILSVAPPPDSPHQPLPVWLGKRARRLLIPYGAWTLIYTSAQAIKIVFVSHDPVGLSRLAADPLGRLLLGGSGVHLYFIPLLFVGLVLTGALRPLLRRLPIGGLLVLLLVFLVCAEWLQRSGNGFELSTNRAFLTALGSPTDSPWWVAFPPVRLMLVALAHTIRCLPFIFLAAIMVRLGPFSRWQTRARLTLGAAATAVLVVGMLQLLRLPEALIGGSGVLLGLAISTGFTGQTPSWISRIGALTFPIYLMHQLPLEAFQYLLRHRMPLPAGLVPALTVAVGAFAAAWLIGRAVEATKNNFLCTAFGIASTPGRRYSSN